MYDLQTSLYCYYKWKFKQTIKRKQANLNITSNAYVYIPSNFVKMDNNFLIINLFIKSH